MATHHDPTYSLIIDAATYNRIISQHRYIRESDGILKAWLAIRAHGASEPLEVLELGTGPGRLTEHLIDLQNIRLTGIDYDDTYLQVARDAVGHAAELHKASAIEYQHPRLLDVVVSQGFHHHIAKGSDTTGYLQAVYRQLKPGGHYVLCDEFVPCYHDNFERLITAILWYSHIISAAQQDRYLTLAEEEAKTLLDDLVEGTTDQKSKSQDQIHLVLEWAANIDGLSMRGNLAEARTEAQRFYHELQRLIPHSNAIQSDLSRGDFKICDRVLREEVEPVGFQISQVIREGPSVDVGGMYVYVLTKPAEP